MDQAGPKAKRITVPAGTPPSTPDPQPAAPRRPLLRTQKYHVEPKLLEKLRHPEHWEEEPTGSEEEAATPGQSASTDGETTKAPHAWDNLLRKFLQGFKG